MSVIVDNISKFYGEQKSVDNLSFSVNKGEILGFLGPNGAGKSTTMKILTTFISPSLGTASVAGCDILTESLEVRRRVGYLPENNPLYLELYVKEYLSFVAGIHQLKNKSSRVKEMIEMTGLEVEQNKKLGQLSKGYRQRVGLAQALIHDPEVLILDEPTAGLDPNQLVEIRQLIKNVGKEKTVIFSTHIMQEVQALCDKVIIINKGRMVANDSIEGLTSKLKGESSIIVEFDSNPNIENYKILEGLIKIEKLQSNKYNFNFNHTKDIRKDIFNIAANNNEVILGMQKETKSIEQIFQSLTTNQNLND